MTFYLYGLSPKNSNFSLTPRKRAEKSKLKDTLQNTHFCIPQNSEVHLNKENLRNFFCLEDTKDT